MKKRIAAAVMTSVMAGMMDDGNADICSKHR